MTPLVSIISVNYDQPEVTCAMLASLRQLTYPRVEIIVVDNASPTRDPAPIAAQFPEVRLLRSARNLGFAGGNNLGIRVARGEYVLFLNNDTEVEPGLLEPLLAAFRQHPRAGIVSPKIIYHHSANRLIQYAGCAGINPWTGRGRTIGSQQPDQGQHDGSYRTGLAHGAAMLLPMAVIRQVGLMPEQYFLYYEEHDWCQMVQRAGYECHYVGSTTVYHKESVSVGRASVLQTHYQYRNRLLYMRRNLRGVQFWVGALYFLLVAVPRHALRFALARQWKHLRALWRGLRWHLQARQVHHNQWLAAPARPATLAA
ncbi:glycosyltransferase family 2 protein [Hymenobacter canadensis]|uniref:Glycosyltransferase family 2 protein n=1 Tax=Hymenobacter canadensis TaxID=2999067 RepID=A0ABY7LV11_9BACT|nr:glycosyltransferase family 2 protein [Hymenobacter canadensis]WBA43075.1 glycosyltransferase family 2 protein [Hymenobacter canadensis]